MSTPLDNLLARFAATARAHHEALEHLDEARANQRTQLLYSLHRVITAAAPDDADPLLALLDHHDPAVAGMAAVFCIRRAPAPCLVVLRRVAQEPGLLGFRAAAAVERWERGEWP